MKREEQLRKMREEAEHEEKYRVEQTTRQKQVEENMEKNKQREVLASR